MIPGHDSHVYNSYIYSRANACQCTRVRTYGLYTAVNRPAFCMHAEQLSTGKRRAGVKNLGTP